jgi:hypothetical protein
MISWGGGGITGQLLTTTGEVAAQPEMARLKASNGILIIIL